MTGIIQALLASIGGVSPPKQFLAVGERNFAGASAVYEWANETLGVAISQPASAPTDTGGTPSWTSDGDALAWGAQSSPFVYAYPFSKTGYGVKFSNPSPVPNFGTGYNAAFSPNKAAIATVGGSDIEAYAWSSSGFGTKFSNPATPPTNTVLGIAFSPDSSAIAATSTGSPYVWAYPWSGSGFGTKFSNPATLMPGGTTSYVQFSPAGTEIATTTADGSTRIYAYPWSGSGFGTKFSDPATLPSGGARGLAFSSDGDYLAVAHAGSPFCTVYPWSSSGFGTAYAGPATSIGTNGNWVDFSPDVGSIAVVDDNFRLLIYAWSSAGWGARTAGTFPNIIEASYNAGIKFGVVE
jgi:WD40 repeat protein